MAASRNSPQRVSATLKPVRPSCKTLLGPLSDGSVYPSLPSISMPAHPIQPESRCSKILCCSTLAPFPSGSNEVCSGRKLSTRSDTLSLWPRKFLLIASIAVPSAISVVAGALAMRPASAGPCARFSARIVDHCRQLPSPCIDEPI